MPSIRTTFGCGRAELRARVQWHLQVLTANAHDANAWHELGSTLMLLGDRAGACAALKNALRLDQGHAPTYRALGNLLFDGGRLEDALACFDHA
jgi:tetratricopeptide (TPR) repeat protein